MDKPVAGGRAERDPVPVLAPCPDGDDVMRDHVEVARDRDAPAVGAGEGLAELALGTVDAGVSLGPLGLDCGALGCAPSRQGGLPVEGAAASHSGNPSMQQSQTPSPTYQDGGR